MCVRECVRARNVHAVLTVASRFEVEEARTAMRSLFRKSLSFINSAGSIHPTVFYLLFRSILFIFYKRETCIERKTNEQTNEKIKKKKKQKKEKRKKERRERCRQVRATVDHYSENAHAYIHTTRTKRDDCFLNRESVYTIPRRARR